MDADKKKTVIAKIKDLLRGGCGEPCDVKREKTRVKRKKLKKKKFKKSSKKKVSDEKEAEKSEKSSDEKEEEKSETQTLIEEQKIHGQVPALHKEPDVGGCKRTVPWRSRQQSWDAWVRNPVSYYPRKLEAEEYEGQPYEYTVQDGPAGDWATFVSPWNKEKILASRSTQTKERHLQKYTSLPTYDDEICTVS